MKIELSNLSEFFKKIKPSKKMVLILPNMAIHQEWFDLCLKNKKLRLIDYEIDYSLPVNTIYYLNKSYYKKLQWF